MVSGIERICCKPSIYQSDECTLARNCYNLSPLARGRIKIFLGNDTSLQTHPNVWVVNVVNPHNVHNKPNDLRYVDTARTASSVSRTSIFGIIAIWSANNTFHILTRMSGRANQAVHIYWCTPRLPIHHRMLRCLRGMNSMLLPWRQDEHWANWCQNTTFIWTFSWTLQSPRSPPPGPWPPGPWPHHPSILNSWFVPGSHPVPAQVRSSRRPSRVQAPPNPHPAPDQSVATSNHLKYEYIL